MKFSRPWYLHTSHYHLPSSLRIVTVVVPEPPVVTLLGRVKGSTLREKLSLCSSILSSIIVTLNVTLVTPAGNETFCGIKMKSDPSVAMCITDRYYNYLKM